MCCITPIWTIYMAYWYIVVAPVKFSSWFSSHINSKTSTELTADNMQTLLTKQEPEDVYNADLYELQKKLSLKLPCDWGK